MLKKNTSLSNHHIASLGVHFSFTIKNKSNANNQYTETIWDKKRELNQKIRSEQTEIKKLEEKLQSVKSKVLEDEMNNSTNEQEEAEIKKQLDEARLFAGFVDSNGPGVPVTLNDNKEVPSNSNVSDYIVHEENVCDVVNDLFFNGAEGISVNGQRLIAASSIRCVGPTVIVNNVQSAPPVKIIAIGDPEKLKSSLELSDGAITKLKKYTNIKVSINKSDNVTLPSYNGDMFQKTS